MLQLDLKDHAQHFIDRLPRKHAGQVLRKIAAMRIDPWPPDSKKLGGSIYRGADIGEYRIIYKIIGETLSVPLIGKRNDGEVYKRLRRMER